MPVEGFMTAEEVEYFARLLARRGSAEWLDPGAVCFRNGKPPDAGKCHENVDRWVSENRNCRAVRGWLIESETSDQAVFTAHSAVDEGYGPLVDITLPISLRFLRHEGSDELWARIEATNRQRVWPQPTLGDPGDEIGDEDRRQF
jgi:hypothetical protein